MLVSLIVYLGSFAFYRESHRDDWNPSRFWYFEEETWGFSFEHLKYRFYQPLILLDRNVLGTKWGEIREI